MGTRHVIVLLAAAASLAGCAAQSRYAQKPVWVGTGINNLQMSDCNCGGVEDKKAFKKRRDAEIKAQQRDARLGHHLDNSDGQN